MKQNTLQNKQLYNNYIYRIYFALEMRQQVQHHSSRLPVYYGMEMSPAYVIHTRFAINMHNCLH